MRRSLSHRQPQRSSRSSAPDQDPCASSAEDPRSRRQSALESALVMNLKKQVACLEKELQCLKSDSQPVLRFASMSAASPGGPPVLPLVNTFTAAEASETVALQFALERLRHDKSTVDAQLLDERRARGAAVKETVALSAALRASEGREAEARRLHRDALDALNTEQGRRRAAEDSAVVKPAVSNDVASEHAYYRVQTDRLRVALHEATARAEEMARQLTDERARAQRAEARLAAAVDETRRLQRASEDQAILCERVEKGYVHVCGMLRFVLDDCCVLERQLRAPQGGSLSSDGDALRRLERMVAYLRGANLTDHNEILTSRSTIMTRDLEPPSPLASAKVNETLPPSAQVPAPPSAQVPAPPSAQVPAPPSAPVPPPPSAQVPAPPSAQVPAPPSAQVPAPPSAQVPAPPSAQVPAPPSAQVPAPPSAQVPPPQSADEHSWDHDELDKKITEIENRIMEEEAALLAYLSK